MSSSGGRSCASQTDTLLVLHAWLKALEMEISTAPQVPHKCGENIDWCFVCMTCIIFLLQPLKRSLVSDLVGSVRALFDEVRLLTSDKSCVSVGVAVVWQVGCWEMYF